jgi:hypothetical protein
MTIRIRIAFSTSNGAKSPVRSWAFYGAPYGLEPPFSLLAMMSGSS